MITIGMLQIVIAGLCFALAAVMLALWVARATPAGNTSASRRVSRQSANLGGQRPLENRTEHAGKSVPATLESTGHTAKCA